MPVTTPPDGQPPCSVYMPSPAKRATSKKFEFLSVRYSILSRAVSFPLSCCSLIFFSPPPSFVFFAFAFNCEQSFLYLFSFLLNSKSIETYFFCAAAFFFSSSCFLRSRSTFFLLLPKGAMKCLGLVLK